MSRAVGIENLGAHIGMIGAQPDHRREILRILFEGLPEQAFRLGELIGAGLGECQVHGSPAAINQRLGVRIVPAARAFQR